MPATPAARLLNRLPAIYLVVASSSHCRPHDVGHFNPNPGVLPSVEQGYAVFDFLSRPRLASVSAVLNQPLFTLGVVALVMNVDVVRRIVICRRAPRLFMLRGLGFGPELWRPQSIWFALRGLPCGL
jgi:hypothetical protein